MNKMNVWTQHITFKPKGNKIKIEKNLSKKVLDEQCWVKKNIDATRTGFLQQVTLSFFQFICV
jgi:hypothetical protein